MVAVRVSTVGAEVAAESLERAEVNRQVAEVVVDDAGTGALLQVSTVGVEVAGSVPSFAQVNRQVAEVVVDDAGTGALLQVSTIGVELAAQTSVPGPSHLPLAAPLKLFMHNWASEVEMETSFETDVTRSRETGAEERRGLMERPERVMTTRWLQQSRAAIDQLVVCLRRMTDENLQVPLYQDMSLVTQDSAGTTLWVDASTRRYFNQGRVIVCPADGQFFDSSQVQVLDILVPLPDRLLLGSSISGTLTAGRFAAAPLIDLEVNLEPSIQMRTIGIGDLTLEAREFKGQSSLPPVGVGLPRGWEVQLGLPIFEIGPDETAGVTTSYLRYGDRQRQGRKQRTFKEGVRYNQVQDYDLILDRLTFFRVLSFFESRKGRLSPFWAIDREFVWSVIDTDPTFIDVTPFGTFADFAQLWTDQNIAAGIVMRDGQIHVRQINTVQDQGGTWRLTLVGGQTLPNIDVTKIQRFARARLSRFERDEMTERWASTAVCRVRLSTVEVQQEKTIDIDP